MIFLWSSAVVHNLVGGTEPHKFHTRIHRTFRSCKSKMCIVNFIYFYCSKSFNYRTLETDSPNTWGSIKPRLWTTALMKTSPRYHLQKSPADEATTLWMGMWRVSSFEDRVYVYTKNLKSKPSAIPFSGRHHLVNNYDKLVDFWRGFVQLPINTFLNSWP